MKEPGLSEQIKPYEYISEWYDTQGKEPFFLNSSYTILMNKQYKTMDAEQGHSYRCQLRVVKQKYNKISNLKFKCTVRNISKDDAIKLTDEWQSFIDSDSTGYQQGEGNETYGDSILKQHLENWLADVTGFKFIKRKYKPREELKAGPHRMPHLNGARQLELALYTSDKNRIRVIFYLYPDDETERSELSLAAFLNDFTSQTHHMVLEGDNSETLYESLNNIQDKSSPAKFSLPADFKSIESSYKLTENNYGYIKTRENTTNLCHTLFIDRDFFEGQLTDDNHVEYVNINVGFYIKNEDAKKVCKGLLTEFGDYGSGESSGIERGKLEYELGPDFPHKTELDAVFKMIFDTCWENNILEPKLKLIFPSEPRKPKHKEDSAQALGTVRIVAYSKGGNKKISINFHLCNKGKVDSLSLTDMLEFACDVEGHKLKERLANIMQFDGHLSYDDLAQKPEIKTKDEKHSDNQTIGKQLQSEKYVHPNRRGSASSARYGPVHSQPPFRGRNRGRGASTDQGKMNRSWDRVRRNRPDNEGHDLSFPGPGK